jgi:hypothetical protein
VKDAAREMPQYAARISAFSPIIPVCQVVNTAVDCLLARGVAPRLWAGVCSFFL